MEDNKVNLVCIAINDVDAILSLQVNWYKGNHLVIPNGKRIIIHNEANKDSRQLISTLLLDPINHNDHGVYTFRASNHHGSYSETRIDLTVQCMVH